MKARVSDLQNQAKEFKEFREECSELMLFCSVIALHQTKGIGAARIEMASAELDAQQVDFGVDIHFHDYDKALANVVRKAQAYCDDPTIHWPMPELSHRSNERQKQITMCEMEREVHTAAFAMWVLAIRRASEKWGDPWSRKRFADLKETTMNYMGEVRNAKDEYDRAAAYERIRRAVQAAMRQKVTIVDRDELRNEHIAEEYIESVAKRSADIIKRQLVSEKADKIARKNGSLLMSESAKAEKLKRIMEGGNYAGSGISHIDYLRHPVRYDQRTIPAAGAKN